MRMVISIMLILCAGAFVVFGGIVLNDRPWREAYDMIDIVRSGQYELSFENDVNESAVDPGSNDKDDRSAKILFGGDMMFDRYIRDVAEKDDYSSIFANIAPLINEHHCVIANLEGPITDNVSVSVSSAIGSPDNYRFTFDPTVSHVLKENNFCIANIGNNHIHNFDSEGIVSTKRYLNAAGVGYFGDTHTANEERYLIYVINDVRFGFVNYNAFVSDADVNVLDDIHGALQKNVDFIVVYAHWGEEYQMAARQSEIDMAHNIIDAGADLIIGSHPHVVQNIEEYKGKKIYYSLGNFIFDQYFSEQTQAGLLVSATFTTSDGGITVEEHKIDLVPTGETRLFYVGRK